MRSAASASSFPQGIDFNIKCGRTTLRGKAHTTIFYSTHILSDVQRISDTVAILNHGRLVAQAPIDDLLAGSGSVTYSVAFKGEANGTREQVAGQGWVSGITAQNPQPGITRWDVAVTDEKAAENNLLRLIMDNGGLVVTEFRRKQHDLEEVFINIVEETNVR